MPTASLTPSAFSNLAVERGGQRDIKRCEKYISLGLCEKYYEIYYKKYYIPCAVLLEIVATIYPQFWILLTRFPFLMWSLSSV
jgi:hypothetical protein